jgi:hypothetical protein
VDVWDDSQPDGPEPQPWQQQPPAGVPKQPHGYFEPSLWSLIDFEEARRRKHWQRLLADNVTAHDVWWKRLMDFLKRNR